jgi:hypothetical protein
MKEEVTVVKAKQPDSALAIISMVLGTLSLVGLEFGFIFGIPAIITSSIALKKKQGGRSLSLAGLITGIIGTAISLVVVVFFVLVGISAPSQPGDYQSPIASPPNQTEQPFIGSQT